MGKQNFELKLKKNVTKKIEVIIVIFIFEVVNFEQEIIPLF